MIVYSMYIHNYVYKCVYIYIYIYVYGDNTILVLVKKERNTHIYIYIYTYDVCVYICKYADEYINNTVYLICIDHQAPLYTIRMSSQLPKLQVAQKALGILRLFHPDSKQNAFCILIIPYQP